MKIIVGLGNPGKKYEKTLHNAGFLVIDELARKYNTELNKEMFNGFYTKIRINSEDVILLKPQTFMNLSGECVGQMCRYFKVDTEDIFVVYDDMEIRFGQLRIRKNGSSGGHNGIKSLIQHLGNQEFPRLKIGVGRPSENRSVVSHVLAQFSPIQEQNLPVLLEAAVGAVEMFIANELRAAMNEYNKVIVEVE